MTPNASAEAGPGAEPGPVPNPVRCRTRSDAASTRAAVIPQGPACLKVAASRRGQVTSVALRRLLAVAVVLPGIIGCSWLTIPRQNDQTGRCTSSRAAPIIDLVAAIAGGATFVAGTVFAIGASTETESDTHNLAVGAGILFAAAGVAVSVPFGFSSAYGFRKTAGCRQAR